GRSGSSALSFARSPTCGPFPWVITRSWSRASGASAATAWRTCASWVSASGGAPRPSSALPPTATTSRPSVPDRGDHRRLDRVQPVLRLVEDDRGRRLEHVLGHLELGQSEPVEELTPHLGV